MLVASNRNILSVLGLAAAVSSAPLNERANVSRGIVGWLCHYDGPSTPLVDASLDLPALLGALCAKVSYEFPGCESFDPNPANDQTPSADGSGVQSASVDQDEDHSDDEHKHPKHPKKKHHKAASHPSSSDPQDDGNGSKPKHPKHPKAKKPHHDSNDDGDDSVAAHSFNDAGDHEPSLPDPSLDAKPQDSPAEKDPNSSVGSLSNGESDDDDTHGCQPTETYSSELGRCVDQSYFSQPESDGTCKIGVLDAVIELCLDISTLGLTDPVHVDASALKSGAAPGAASNASQKCAPGQQYSSLLSVCVDDTFFSDPLAGDQCEHGWKLDLVLGICLDLIGCQNQSHDA